MWCFEKQNYEFQDSVPSYSGHKHRHKRIFFVFVSKIPGFCIPTLATNTQDWEKNPVTTHRNGVTIHRNRQNWQFLCVEGPILCVHTRIVSIIFEQLQKAVTSPIRSNLAPKITTTRADRVTNLQHHNNTQQPTLLLLVRSSTCPFMLPPLLKLCVIAPWPKQWVSIHSKLV